MSAALLQPPTPGASNLQPNAFNDMRPLASISLDLDNQWSYMKTYGDSGWKDLPSYFDTLIPYSLDALDFLNLKITFFVVGQDAALKRNRDALKQICNRGHELGNHSFNHDPWLHSFNRSEIENEILQTEECITQISEEKPLGFRGPGFSWSKEVIDVLYDSGYLYDSTTMPTFIGPLARAYYFRNQKLSSDEKNKRRGLLDMRKVINPIKPYWWELSTRKKMLEIPVTTIPVIKTPFHMSYLLFLGRFSVIAMLLYFNIAMAMCRLTGTEPNFVIHPTDILGGDQVPNMRFFPGMELSKDRKLQLFYKVIKIFSRHFHLVNMSTHAKSILKRNNLKTIQL